MPPSDVRLVEVFCIDAVSVTVDILSMKNTTLTVVQYLPVYYDSYFRNIVYLSNVFFL